MGKQYKAYTETELLGSHKKQIADTTNSYQMALNTLAEKGWLYDHQTTVKGRTLYVFSKES